MDIMNRSHYHMIIHKYVKDVVDVLLMDKDMQYIVIIV